jgi:beta-glucanase (GH16 family)
MPVAPYAWPAFWLNPGVETPPDHPGGKPHISVLDWPPEIDIFDEFGFNGEKPGHYLISGTPTNHHDAAFGNPHDTYRAPDYGNKWYYQPKQDLTAGFHTYGFNWGRDNILSYLLDGRVYKRTYYEWHSKGNVPAHLIASLQIGAKFNDLSHITDQGGIPDGWDWPIDYIRVWTDVN